MSLNPNRVLEIYQQIVALEADQRLAALDLACGSDSELRGAIVALLQTQGGIQLGAGVETIASESGGQCENTGAIAGNGGTATFRSVAAEGVIISGRYELQQKLGEGGMGTVWAAKQTEPVKRRVALKVVKAGLDTSAVLARFEQERQALALMDHPNIARVFDGGATPTGQPYFVMELVHGQSLTKFCDSSKLTPRQRLELFVPICNAVQHAHQKGIVHRDLKPANILVTMIDGRPVPKIIDFGVAKATSGDLTDAVNTTQFGAVIGTLEYMAPEQAGATNGDIDTRADIYSLGVILYELLTGLRPIDAARLRKAGFAEMIRVIQEEEPSRPSTRLSTNESFPSLAAVRQTEPRKLVSMLRGELDWVVMKCLEKSRDRRYETVSGLARDLQRYLTNEPVEARPASLQYRAGKFLQRNKGAVTAACLLLLALVAGVIGTSIGMVRANSQRQIAEAAVTREREALGREVEQRELAEAANRQAYEALKAFTDDVMEKVLASREKLTENERSLLLNAQKQWEVYSQSKADTPQARVIRGDGAENVAKIQNKLGMNEESLANHRTALTLRSALATEFPKEPIYRRQTAASHQCIGALLRTSGKTLAAEEQFQLAVEIYDRLAKEDPASNVYRSRLSESQISRANIARDQGKWEEAERFYNQALAIQEQLVADFPAERDYEFSAARSHWGLAFLKKKMEQLGEAEGHYRQAIATFERLAEKSPEKLDFRQGVAGLRRELGALFADNGDFETGARELQLGIVIQEKLVADFPSAPQNRVELARSCRDLGKCLGKQKKFDEAKEQFLRAEALFEKLVSDAPAVGAHQSDLGLTYHQHAELLNFIDDPLACLSWHEKAVQVLSAAYAQSPNYVLGKNSLALSHAGRAAVFTKLARHSEARKDWDRALELVNAKDAPQVRIGSALAKLRAGDVAQALQEAAELELLSELKHESWCNLARLHAVAMLSAPEQKQLHADRAMECLRKAVNAGFRERDLLANDVDLKLLREREDFKHLLMEVETKLPSER